MCCIGQQLAAALEHAHAHGIVHRDFKTANVMLTSDGRSTVLDFGIATRAESPQDATRTMTQPASNALMAGTLAYMAPEVLQGHLADARSDIWSLGVVLQEMTSGRAPFEKQTNSDLAAAILRDAPAPLPSGTPAALARIIERCLAKEPDQRPAHAGEVALALDVASPATSTLLWATGCGLVRRGETGRPRPVMRIPSPWPRAHTAYRPCMRGAGAFVLEFSIDLPASFRLASVRFLTPVLLEAP